MADLLNIGLSGLSASKTSLSIVGHNITNVNTPGYSRQDTIQATRPAQFSGAGYIGSGTTLTDVRRIYNEFLTNQVRSSTALDSDAQAYLSQISQLDSLLAGSTTSLTQGLQKMFAALQTAAEDPSNIPARQLVLSEAQGVANRFNTVYDRLAEQNSFINKQLSAVSDQVNQLATSVASYNNAIAVASSNGQVPNDLLDAREEAVRQLSTYIGVTVVPQDDNSYNLFIGSGQPLVVGATAAKLQVVPGQSDPLRSEVQFVSGNSVQNVTTLISGGEMGGLIRYRQDVLDPSMNAVGRLALSVADQLNSQLAQGLDLKGQIGTNLFLDINDPSLTGFRSLARASNSDPSASLNVLIGNSSQLTTSDYELEFTSATDYTLRRTSDGTSFGPFNTATTPAPEIDGFSVQVASGSFAAGDRFLVMPTRTAGSSITKILDQADQLAFAAPVRSLADGQNSGTGVISQPELQTGGAAIDLTTLQGAVPVTLTYDAATENFTLPAGATLTRINSADGSPATPATFVTGQQNTYQLQLADGSTLRLSLSGRPADGDAFTVAFNANGVSDNRNALKLADLQTKATIGVDPNIAGTGTSFTDAYGDLVERVGTLTSQARTDSEATGSILKQATDNRDSISGVSLDEEAAKLIQFEQYYQASAQIIQVARSLFDTLINSF